METKPCPLCGRQSSVDLVFKENLPVYQFVDCPVCGWFQVESSLLSRILDHGEFRDQLYLLSALSRRNYDRQQPREVNHGIKPFIIDANTIEEHLNSISIPMDPLDRVDRLLQVLFDRTKSFDEGALVDSDVDCPLIFVRSPKEFEYIGRLASKVGVVEIPHHGKMVLTAEGYERVRELRSSGTTTSQVFVAMWFNEETDAAWADGFLPALRDDLGYEPVRIDKREHINKIDDEIISAIRESGFLVADFTGDRGGVYFEAGFAMGLGKPVVWCCRDDKWAQKLHFDTRQYSHIMWQNPTDLRERLVARVRAVISPMLPL